MQDEQQPSYLDVIFASPVSNQFKEEQYIDCLKARGTFVPEMAHRSADGCSTHKNRVSFVNALQSVYRVAPNARNRLPLGSANGKYEQAVPLKKNMSWDSCSYFKQGDPENEKENSWLVGSAGSRDQGIALLYKELQFNEAFLEGLACIARTTSEIEPVEVSEFSFLPLQQLYLIPQLTKMNEIAAVETYSYDDSGVFDRLNQDFQDGPLMPEQPLDPPPEAQMRQQPLPQASQVSEQPTYPKCDPLSKQSFVWGRQLGKGHFGTVHIATHKVTGFTCAIKRVSKQTIKSEKVEQQIIHELKIQSACDHPNICQLYGYFLDEEYLYIMQELCTDGQLFDLLKKKNRVEQEQASYLIRQVLEGIRYLHLKCIIHRDIKPQNILLQSGVVKICDMGWAVHTMGLRISRCGTPLYQSPQVIKGIAYDQRVDIWAVGAITFQLLTSMIPFKIWCQDDLKKIVHANPMQVQDEVVFPPYLDISETAMDFIKLALVKQPVLRVRSLDLLLHPFVSEVDVNKFIPI